MRGYPRFKLKPLYHNDPEADTDDPRRFASYGEWRRYLAAAQRDRQAKELARRIVKAVLDKEE